MQMHTGSANAGVAHPAVASARGSCTDSAPRTRTCPATSPINPPPNFGGAVNYGSAFLPAHFQGTRITDAGYLPNLRATIGDSTLQRKQLDLIQDR